MKIGILTLPLHINYGGILQAYALQTVLERMGHEVYLIEEFRQIGPPWWKLPLCYGKRILNNLLGHPFPIFYEQKEKRERPVVRQYIDRFILQYIHRKTFKHFHEIKESDFDLIVVGSDQVWRPKYFGKIEHAYLDFTKGWNIHRIAYAASFGTDNWEYTPQQTKICKECIQRFDAVSVREDEGVKLCKEQFEIDALHLIDPTMLLTKEDYIHLFETAKTPKSNGNLLCYILEDTTQKECFIDKVAKTKGLKPFRVNAKVDYNKYALVERIQPPVEAWLRGFYDAEFVVTDSFHACVFSIIFNKPFIVIGDESRGLSRLYSLLKMFKLEDRLVVGNNYPVEVTDISDWEYISSQLTLQKEKANRFLSKFM